MAATKILFICIGNTCRSPMAEAIARKLGGDSVRTFSAGLSPTGRVAPEAIRALEHLDYPAGGLASKGLEAVPLEEMDVIVSLLGAEGLRFLPLRLAAERLAWEIRDPYGEDEEAFVAAAIRIEDRIKKLLADLQEEELSFT